MLYYAIYNFSPRSATCSELRRPERRLTSVVAQVGLAGGDDFM